MFPALKRLRQEDCPKSEARLGYRVRSVELAGLHTQQDAHFKSKLKKVVLAASDWEAAERKTLGIGKPASFVFTDLFTEGWKGEGYLEGN